MTDNRRENEAIERWLGMFDQPITHPTHCDLCSTELKSIVYDSKVKNFGAWAYMCESCFPIAGNGLGIGRGTKMTRNADGTWKVQRNKS